MFEPSGSGCGENGSAGSRYEADYRTGWKQAAQNNGYEKAIFCEARNGIYFLKTVGEVYSNQQSYELIFYDIAAKTYQTVYSYDRAETAYSSAEAVYFLESSSKSEGNGQTSYDIVITRYDLNSGAVSEIKPEVCTAASTGQDL